MKDTERMVIMAHPGKTPEISIKQKSMSGGLPYVEIELKFKDTDFIFFSPPDVSSAEQWGRDWIQALNKAVEELANG